MENNVLEKISSFAKYGYVSGPTTHNSQDSTEKAISDHRASIDMDSAVAEEELRIHDQDIHMVNDDVDRFTDTLSSVDDKSDPPEVPETVETFAKIVESRLSRYHAGQLENKFRKLSDEDSLFFEAVMRLSKLTNAFGEFPAGSTISSSLNRTSAVLQKAMTLMEEELRSLLEDSSSRVSRSSSRRMSIAASFKNSKQDDPDRCTLPNNVSSEDAESFPGYSPEGVARMNRIATAMMSAGYETECCQAYSISRKFAFNEQMQKLEFEKINVEDVQRMPWESLEGEISRWVTAVKACTTTLFPGERTLGESVFSEYPLISRSLFSNLARAVVIQLLDFAEAVSMTKRSAEKLFKLLDMYEVLRDLIQVISESCTEDFQHELKSEIIATCDRVGGAALNMFLELENSIKSEVTRTPVPGGAVHPLTRYVMNYLRYACEYRVTMEQILERRAKLETHTAVPVCESETTAPERTAFSTHVLNVMDLLDAYLEAKSSLYKDPSLRYIFLMNNGRYTLQKVKGSAEIHQVMGDTWYRRKSTVVRQFHKNYQRETWVKLLQCLSHEGLQVNGKVQRPALKERFKSFNTMFEEIHRTQSTWVVSDEQLQSELRVSVSAVVIPAYRSFLGRFRQYFDASRHVGKYIKYQPEDIETLIEGLFDGNPTSMTRKRT